MDPDYTPGSPAWTRRITATKVAAILGVSPWDSPRSMWAKMRGEMPEGMDAETAGLFPDAMEEVEGWEVPRGWRVGKMSDVARQVKQQMMPNTELAPPSWTRS